MEDRKRINDMENLRKLPAYVYRNSGLSVSDIVRAFPEEAKEHVPTELRRVKKWLSEWEKEVAEIKDLLLEPAHTSVLIAINNMRYGDMLKKKISHKQNLEAMKRIMTGEYQEITPEMIERANSVPVHTLYSFENSGKYGGRFRACCPFHDERTASFFVLSKNRWRCFGACAEGGDAINFVRKLHGFGFVQAVKYLLGEHK